MKIHIISNNPIGLNSGFGIVARNLGIGLKRLGHDISFTGLQTSYVQSKYQGMTVYPVNYLSTGDSLSQIIDSVNYNLHKVKPDAVICIFQGDDGRLNQLTKLHKNTFWYCPIEGAGMPAGLVEDMGDPRVQPVFMTNQGALEYLSSPEMTGDEVAPIIYHGYDPNIFYPVYNKPVETPLCKWYTEHYKYQQDPVFLCENCCFRCDGMDGGCPNHELEEITLLSTKGEEVVPYTELMNIKERFDVKTVFLFVGQNFGVRKRIERLIEAFAKFAQGKEDVLLHLHTYPVPSTGIDLIAEVQKHGIIDKVLFSYGTLRSSGWSDQTMNLLYNSADIFVSASSAEGFGLPHLESMSVGLPQIAPYFSVFPEFITGGGLGDRGLLCDVTEQLTITGQTRALVDIDELANFGMFEIYNSLDARKTMSENAIKWASYHIWEKKCAEWDKLLRGV